VRVKDFAVAIGIVLSQPAMAECAGSYPAMMCVSKEGDVSYYGGYYGRYYSYSRQKGYGTARISNPATNSQAKPQTSASGVTTVLQPSAQTGNAWVVKPQDSGGATVLGQGATGLQ
jgi:hypothetical protein